MHSKGADANTWDVVTGGGTAAWITQEHQKGRYSVSSGLQTPEAGWGFNCRSDQWQWVPDFFCITNSGLSKTEAFAKTPDELRLKPFAKPFPFDDLYSDQLSISNAVVDEYKDHMLAVGVPALSHAAGSTDLVNLSTDESFDMNTVFKKVWPAERGFDPEDKGWKHSDAKDVAYRYTFGLYNAWVVIGSLK